MTTKQGVLETTREEEQRKRNITDEAKYDRLSTEECRESLNIRRRMNAFYGRYATKGRVSTYQRRGNALTSSIEHTERQQRVVADKDFSPRLTKQWALQSDRRSIDLNA